MPTTTITSRKFNQDVGAAKRAARTGPVIITDRGKPAHVLMSIDEYRKLTEHRMSLSEALAHPPSEDIEFDPPRLEGLFQPVDLD
jgi:prevent-host-death family protein